MTPATVEAPGVVITEPGVYDLTATEYHRDPVPGGSLSSSGARKLLPPSCPAKYKWERDHGAPPKDCYDLGHVAHTVILGKGVEIARINHDSYKLKAAQEAKKEAHAAGAAPVLDPQWEQVQEMAAMIRAHPIASALLNPDRGEAEKCLFWHDDEHRVWRRAMLDCVTELPNGRVGAVDYKTAESAERDKFSRSAAEHGYHQQDAWYCDALEALDISLDPFFLFVVQEKKPPYLVNVVELDVPSRKIGAYLNRKALRTFAECQSTGVWPGYSSDVEHVSLPYWYESRMTAEMEISR